MIGPFRFRPHTYCFDLLRSINLLILRTTIHKPIAPSHKLGHNLVIVKPEFKKNTKVTRTKKRPSHSALVKRRVSVSEAKAHLSSVLKQVQGGQSIIVTDHGKDIACIDGIREGSQLKIIPAQRPFSEVRDIRAPISTESKPTRSILELLHEDRNSR